MGTIEVGRCNSRRFERFRGRGAGYDLIAHGRGRSWLCGHAVPIINLAGRERGWIILDPDTGETILGAGHSTMIGFGLADACFLFAARLELGENKP